MVAVQRVSVLACTLLALGLLAAAPAPMAEAAITNIQVDISAIMRVGLFVIDLVDLTTSYLHEAYGTHLILDFYTEHTSVRAGVRGLWWARVMRSAVLARFFHSGTPDAFGDACGRLELTQFLCAGWVSALRVHPNQERCRCA
eukprot:m.144777 g.144777  ORF g.144777 m.144777 type:complete len:143 (-) comp10071_c1_seq2:1065-1493(-)